MNTLGYNPATIVHVYRKFDASAQKHLLADLLGLANTADMSRTGQEVLVGGELKRWATCILVNIRFAKVLNGNVLEVRRKDYSFKDAYYVVASHAPIYAAIATGIEITKQEYELKPTPKL